MTYRIVFVTFICVLFSLASCRHEPKELTRKEKALAENAGILTADLNGQNWVHTVTSATYIPFDTPTFTFGVEVFEGDYGTQILDFWGIRLNKKVNVLHSFTVYSQDDEVPKGLFHNTDEDVPLTTYQIVEGTKDTSYVEIESYDPNTNQVSGNFKATFYREGGNLIPGFTDTLKFTNGKFNLKISPVIK